MNLLKVLVLKQRFSATKTLPLVILRHGKTANNHNKVWSSWMDSRLSDQGIRQAQQSGQLLKKQGYHFDAVYCSMLSRTIQTSHHILDHMNQLYVPVNKRWELNQKFYGALIGQSKLKCVEKYGEKQINQWRRSYTSAPPPVTKQDHRHPLNDPRYKNIDPTLLPSTQNLGDVLKRLTHLYQAQIKQQLLKGKKILIVGHGIVIRVWTRILLDWNQQQSQTFQVPNATPIVLNLDPVTLKAANLHLVGDTAQIQNKINILNNELKNNQN